MSPVWWARARAAGTVLVLGVLVWRLGTGPFLRGLRTVDGGTLAEGAGIGALTTLCCAWRWKTVAGALGVRVSLRAAVAAYYRSQFLNVTLPGGVAGDVHRGLSHGREISDVRGALGAVVLERFAGQVVQAVLTIVVLLLLPSPVQATMPLVAIAILGTALGGLLILRLRPGSMRRRLAQLRGPAAARRGGVLPRRAWLGIALASALVVAGHAITFLIAARTAGVAAAPARILPLALLAMMAMVLPSAGGWGPREGVTAWAFGAAGLGAQLGVATAVIYGVMALVASLPGAAILVVASLRRAGLPRPERPSLREEPAHA